MMSILRSLLVLSYDLVDRSNGLLSSDVPLHVARRKITWVPSHYIEAASVIVHSFDDTHKY